MEPNPEKSPELTFLEAIPGEYRIDVERTAEDHVFGVLEFLGGMPAMEVRVAYTDFFGDTVEISDEEFRELRELDPLDRETFFRGKAHDILCGSDFRVNITHLQNA